MVSTGREENLLGLWRAVIRQARIDLIWNPEQTHNKQTTKYREKYNARKTARWWLGTPDFYEVCKYAHLNAKKVLTELRKLL